MSDDAEKDLEAFLSTVPAYMRKEFEQGFYSLTEDEMNQLASCLPDGPERSARLRREAELSEEYERLLKRVPAKLKEYRNRLTRDVLRAYGPLLPKASPGRKKNVELAERIWALDAQGKSNREIQETLNAGGESLSLEAVESYLKKRRMPPAR